MEELEFELLLEEVDELELELLEDPDFELLELPDFELLPELLEPDEWLVLFPTPEWAAEAKTNERMVNRVSTASSFFFICEHGPILLVK